MLCRPRTDLWCIAITKEPLFSKRSNLLRQAEMLGWCDALMEPFIKEEILQYANLLTQGIWYGPRLREEAVFLVYKLLTMCMPRLATGSNAIAKQMEF